MIELKKLQKKIQEVRAELQKLVDQEYRLWGSPPEVQCFG
jgi:hypothetical protein